MSRLVLFLLLGAVLLRIVSVQAGEMPIWHLTLSNESAKELEGGLVKFRNFFNPELA